MYIVCIHTYTTYIVLPLVESGSLIWNPDPVYIPNSNHIENIHKYFTK